MKSIKQLTDSQLIQLLKRDDGKAFAEIYTRYVKSLSGFTASKLFCLEDAQDIIHDLFVKLWEDRGKLQINSNLKTYLFTIARRRIVDKIRRNVTSETYAATLRSLADIYQPNIEQQLSVSELKKSIDTVINKLSPRVKEIYHLSREENLSIREIALKLDLSEQTVKNQLSTALVHLRHSLSVYVSGFVLWLFS